MLPALALPERGKLGDALVELFEGPWGPAVRAVGVLVVLAILAFLAARWMRSHRRRAPQTEPDYGTVFQSLPELGPPHEGPRLLYRGTPVRLAGVVLAPPGLARELPPVNRLGEAFDALVPGLSEVIRAHRPVYRRWPAQVSTRGFAHRFFAEARGLAPPDAETPWCLVVGPFVFQRETLLVGLAMRAGAPMRPGRYIVEDPTEWPRLLSVALPPFGPSGTDRRL